MMDTEAKAIGIICLVLELLFLSIVNVNLPTFMIGIYNASKLTFYTVAFFLAFGLIYGTVVTAVWWRKTRTIIGGIDDGGC